MSQIMSKKAYITQLENYLLKSTKNELCEIIRRFANEKKSTERQDFLDSLKKLGTDSSKCSENNLIAKINKIVKKY